MSTLKRMSFIVFGWIAVSYGAAVLGTVFQVFTLSARRSVPTSLGANLRQVGYDIAHFTPLYVVFVAIGFAIAFAVAALLRRVTGLRGRAAGDWLYVLAGVVSIWVMFWAMENVMFGLPAIAGARFTGGLLLQMVTGGLAGGVFAFLIRPGNLRRDARVPASSS